MFINELRAELGDGALKERIVIALKLIKEPVVKSNRENSWVDLKLNETFYTCSALMVC